MSAAHPTRRAGRAPRAAPQPPRELYRSPTGYVLHDPRLAELSGIDAIPLPTFTPESTPDQVLAHLRSHGGARRVVFCPASPYLHPRP